VLPLPDIFIDIISFWFQGYSKVLCIQTKVFATKLISLRAIFIMPMNYEKC
jgi:hypothetical protein